jgi:hypothetical protein
MTSEIHPTLAWALAQQRLYAEQRREWRRVHPVNRPEECEGMVEEKKENEK